MISDWLSEQKGWDRGCGGWQAPKGPGGQAVARICQSKKMDLPASPERRTSMDHPNGTGAVSGGGHLALRPWQQQPEGISRSNRIGAWLVPPDVPSLATQGQANQERFGGTRSTLGP